MKSASYTALSIILLFILFSVCSCAHRSAFTKRKYTPGNYFAFRAAKPEVKSQQLKAEIKKSIVKTEEKVFCSTPQAPVSILANPITDIRKISENDPIAFASRAPVKKIEGFKALPTDTLKKNSGVDVSKSNIPLWSIILSGLGLIWDAAVLVMTIGLLQFPLTYLLVFGAALGVAGIVLGIIGIRNFNRKKNAGVKHTSELVLSIVSLYLGVGAIVLAFVFAIFIYISFLLYGI